MNPVITKVFVAINVFLISEVIATIRVKVKAPPYMYVGESAVLYCIYELGDYNVLYSVNWYKDNEEFYRFIPKSKPTKYTYNISGVYVDTKLSDKMKVYLYRLDIKSSGLYRCEVTAEAPFFQSAQNESRMDVIYLADNDPEISGVKHQYEINDDVHLNCTTAKSYPAQKVRWFINDQEVISDNSTTFINISRETHSDEYITTTLNLQFTLDSGHFINGLMRVRCEATMYLNPTTKHQQSAIIETREALLLVKSGAVKLSSVPLHAVTIVVGTLLVLYEISFLLSTF